MKTQILILFLIFSVLFSCKKKNETSNNSNDSVVEIVENQDIINNIPDVPDETTDFSDSSVNISEVKSNQTDNRCEILETYKILLPSDIFIKSTVLKPNFDDLYQVDKSILNTTNAKALAMGVASSDLVYAAFFNNKTYVDKYYAVIDNLADDLGLQNILDKKSLEKLQNETDFNTIDTFVIKKLTLICSELSDQNSAPKLGLVIFGGWTESNYLLIRLIKQNENTDSLYQKLYQQKEVAVSMINFYNDILPDISDYNVSLAIQTIIDDLKGIQNVYNVVYANDSYLIDKKYLAKLDSVFTQNRNNLFVSPQRKIEMSVARPQK